MRFSGLRLLEAPRGARARGRGGDGGGDDGNNAPWREDYRRNGRAGKRAPFP